MIQQYVKKGSNSYYDFGGSELHSTPLELPWDVRPQLETFAFVQGQQMVRPPRQGRDIHVLFDLMGFPTEQDLVDEIEEIQSRTGKLRGILGIGEDVNSLIPYDNCVFLGMWTQHHRQIFLGSLHGWGLADSVLVWRQLDK